MNALSLVSYYTNLKAKKDELFSQTFGARLGRIYRYHKENRGILKIYTVKVIKHSAIGAGVGLIGGAAIGSLGGPFGASGGAALGAGVGALYGSAKHVIDLRRSTELVNWMEEAIHKDIFRPFREFCEQTPGMVSVLDDLERTYRCPLSLELPKHPMRAPDGTVYDQAALEAEFKNKESALHATVRREELIYAPDHFRNIVERMSLIYSNHLSMLPTTDVTRIGGAKVLSAVREEYIEMTSVRMRTLTEWRFSEVISDDEYHSQMDALTGRARVKVL